jgi:hypothetical protein
VRFVVKPNPYWPYTPASGPPARFVFSVATGLKAAPIGSPTATYGKLFKTARRLANLGGKTTCFSLAYAVSAEAKRSQRPDLLLACGDRRYITEAHFRSSAFCSTNRTCVGTAGSLRGFVRELGPRAYLRLYDECGTRTCSVVTASYGRIRLALRSANCPRVRTLREIAPRCVASEVLIYRSP